MNILPIFKSNSITQAVASSQKTNTYAEAASTRHAGATSLHQAYDIPVPPDLKMHSPSAHVYKRPAARRNAKTLYPPGRMPVLSLPVQSRQNFPAVSSWTRGNAGVKKSQEVSIVPKGLKGKGERKKEQNSMEVPVFSHKQRGHFTSLHWTR